MRIDELKSPYRELAEMRMQKHEGFISANYRLTTAFDWISTSEGVYFWNEVNQGGNPIIPQSSLYELKGYEAEILQMKLDNIGSEDEKKSKASIDEIFGELEKSKKDDKLFTAAVAAMQGYIVISNFGDTYIKPSDVATEAWDFAEALIKEGKERKHL